MIRKRLFLVLAITFFYAQMRMLKAFLSVLRTEQRMLPKMQ